MLKQLAMALALSLPLGAQASDFLDPNQAFRLAAKGATPGLVELVFDIQPGHYMYREKFSVRSDAGEEIPVSAWPAGERKFDEAFQKDMDIHRGLLRVTLRADVATTSLRVTGQGCADKGLCYAPMTSTLVLGSDARWTLQPGADPVGEFGQASLEGMANPGAVASPRRATWGVWTAVFGVVFSLLLVGRKF